MDTCYRSDLAFPLQLVADPGVQHRITIPVRRVLEFARHEPGFHPPTRQVAQALRQLLGAALAAAGLAEDSASSVPLAAACPSEPEILFTALSSLVEVVKGLTPGSGRMYAHLGHEALPERCAEDTAATLAPRAEVVIELVSVANSLCDAAVMSPPGAAGALAFELAAVAAVVESRGGQLSLASDGACSRTFVVRLPVQRTC